MYEHGYETISTNEYEPIFLKWRERSTIPDLREELTAIEQNPDEIIDRFYKNLEFGTGGMRGVIGAGLNRMNIYTVRKATQGLANYINKTTAPAERKVVIAYDSRHKSKDFAQEAALVLVNNSIKAFLFEDITPTPLLSFAVRELKTFFGIVVTASHNPKEYNGYKVYCSHGGQITDELATLLTAEIERITDVFDIGTAEMDKALNDGMLIWLKDEILNKYVNATQKLILNKQLITQNSSDLKVVYSPLHGTGLVPLTKLFATCGFNNLHPVAEQAKADPDFPTVVSPNPEEDAAAALSLQTAEKIDADLIMLTDPDADRLGVIVKDEKGRFVRLTGNQIGALLIDYLLQTRSRLNTLPANGVIIKTIVTSDLGVEIAADYGVKHLDVLTGFKYIGEQIADFVKHAEHVFLFGYEESYGFLIGDFVRDKDAIQTALCTAEAALHHKTNGSGLYQRLQELFARYGYYLEDQKNIHLTGIAGQKTIKNIMETLRQALPQPLQRLGIISVKDYQSGVETPINLPLSDVLYYRLQQDSWCCVRPSGTEPKLKIYFGVREKNRTAAEKRLAQLKEAFFTVLQPWFEDIR